MAEGESSAMCDERRRDHASSDDASSQVSCSASANAEALTQKVKTKKKKKVPGVVYLSYIPPKMNVKTVRSMLSKYGELGRIFLQPEKEHGKPRNFVEGWVEFMDKKSG
uniref:ESF2/ABP1 family protein n=1 Tax=Rhipicephalus zambeziensis TaxID=60191 RepID=A0A224YST5_9ACAR